MDKFTIYDFMSYFLPGVIALFILRLITTIDYSFLTIFSDIETGLVFSIAAILVGLLNHRITFWLLRFQWYQYLIMPSIKKLVKANPDNVKADYDQLILLTKETDEAKLFDNAFYYLECKDRISSARGFQSMYFFIRNVITLLILTIPIILIVWPTSRSICPRTVFCLSLASASCIVVLSWMGRWYREKLVIRIFKTYLASLTIDNSEPTKS